MVTEEMHCEFGRAIGHELSFLRDMGYRFAGVSEYASEALGARLEGGYTNAAVNRTVRVVYLPGHNTPRSVATTDVALVVPEPVAEFDYTTLQSMQVCVTDLSAAVGFTAGFNQHLREASRVLRERFGEVLAGRAWQSDQLDWGDMK